MKISKAVLAAALAAALCAAVTERADACLWDRDTLEAEGQAFPEVIDVVTGRFPRNPPAYHVRRLELATERVAADADDLASYDDAAVACDRLGRSDEAIEWMERKRARLVAFSEAGTETGDHRYRYLANLGTFHAHRWVRGGADWNDLADLERSRDLIARAITVNPDAHFGRERYQLRAIDWLLTAEPWRGAGERKPPLGDILGLQGSAAELQTDGRQREKVLVEKGIGDAVKGLCGLIVLGNAWESVDVFHALTLALQAEGHTSLAWMARLRLEELVADGRRSLRPGAPTGGALLAVTFAPHLLEDGDLEDVRAAYRARRSAAREWLAGRSGEILRRLREGRHPDTHPDFWDGIDD